MKGNTRPSGIEFMKILLTAALFRTKDGTGLTDYDSRSILAPRSSIRNGRMNFGGGLELTSGRKCKEVAVVQRELHKLKRAFSNSPDRNFRRLVVENISERFVDEL